MVSLYFHIFPSCAFYPDFFFSFNFNIMELCLSNSTKIWGNHDPVRSTELVVSSFTEDNCNVPVPKLIGR